MIVMSKVQIYTDGACSGNPGPGGWSAILVAGGAEKELSNGKAHTTNNEMELMAAVEGLRALTRPTEVELYADSNYLVKCMQEGWHKKWLTNGWRTSKGEPVANKEIWIQLLELCKTHKVEFLKVKGHAGHEYNERCDALAKAATQAAASEEPVRSMEEMEYALVNGLRQAVLADQQEIPAQSISELNRPAREMAQQLTGMSKLEAAVAVTKMDRRLLELTALQLVEMYLD